jgi:hypothetical protein
MLGPGETSLDIILPIGISALRFLSMFLMVLLVRRLEMVRLLFLNTFTAL